MAAALKGYKPVEVQAIQVGDAYLVGVPGVLFAEYGRRLKKETQDKVFVVSLVNGDTQGYIATPEAEAARKNEAMYSLFGPEAGEVVVKTASTLIQELQNPATAKPLKTRAAIPRK